jgi:hypothetical protein
MIAIAKCSTSPLLYATQCHRSVWFFGEKIRCGVHISVRKDAVCHFSIASAWSANAQDSAAEVRETVSHTLIIWPTIDGINTDEN